MLPITEALPLLFSILGKLPFCGFFFESIALLRNFESKETRKAQVSEELTHTCYCWQAALVLHWQTKR